ncbi:MAG TPA: hypothetical protein VGD40_12325 [Chryseosolibacter sp.]
MKALTYILSLLIGISSVMLISSCDGDDSPTAQEAQLKKLTAKTWEVQSVRIDGVDHTQLFQNMTLAISKSSFTTTNGGQVWPASGTWEFADEQATTIIRGDNITITIEAAAESELRLSLQWNETTFGPGRKKSISGMHVFSFN